MAEWHYDRVDDNIAHYRVMAADETLPAKQRTLYRTRAKKLERLYLQDITKTGVPELIRARPRSEHTIGRWAVYFVLARKCGRVKIGTTRNVRDRMSTLQGCAPEPYTFLGWIPGGLAIERGLHKKLSDCRAFGEWFEIGETLTEELARFGLTIPDE